MGRSSQQDAARNRARIVDTASRLFRRHGVEGVSIADVMGAAGMTAGGFYRHFESKEALVEEALALAFEQSAASWQSACERPAANAQSGPHVLVHHYFKRRSTDYTCPMLAFAPHVGSDVADQQSAGLYGEWTEALFQQFLDQAQGAGKKSGPAPAAVHNAMLLFAAMVGAGFLARAAGDTPWIRSLQAAVLQAADKGTSRP